MASQRRLLGSQATFQFKNEPVDGVSGLQPMGARMYDPTAGVFLIPDPLTVGLPAAGYMLNPGILYPVASVEVVEK